MLRGVRVFALTASRFLIGPPEGGHYVTVGAQDRAARRFDIYVIDVERGNANARNGF